MTAMPRPLPHQPRMQLAFRHDWGRDLRLLISRIAGAPVHVCTLYDDACYDVPFSGMRRITRADRFAKGDWEVVMVPPRYITTLGMALAEQRIGWRYDWAGAAYAWWLGRPAGRGSAERVFCSEQAADELLANGVPLRYRRAARYTPRLLRDELVERLGWPSVRLERAA